MVITHDVDEAVIMATRVYVLEGDPRGGIPSTIAGEVSINHQVEGPFDLSPEFLTAKREVLALLGSIRGGRVTLYRSHFLPQRLAKHR